MGRQDKYRHRLAILDHIDHLPGHAPGFFYLAGLTAFTPGPARGSFSLTAARNITNLLTIS
jgi:hypothetical protein